MDWATLGILISTLIVLLLIGVPVGFGLGLAGLAAIMTVGPQFLLQVPLTLVRSFSDVILVAIPLFILMGELLYHGRVGQNLFDTANSWLHRTRGGAGVSAVFAFTFFAAIVGSSMASVLSIGKIAIPEMESRGYSKRLTYGLTAVGGSLGILIPPSIPLIVYASLSDTSPGQLFTAAVLPGLAIAVLLCIWTVSSAPVNVSAQPFRLGEALRATLHALPELLLPVVVLGGIYAGIYTPTEAAAVGVAYALLLTLVIRRTLGVRELADVLVGTLRSNGALLTIVAGAMVFGSALTLIGLPQFLSNQVSGSGLEPWAVLLILSLVWLVMGMFLEVISIILITVPVFFPIATAAGIDPIWFGVFMVINMEISVITPPVGMNLFAIKAIRPTEPLGLIARSAVPTILILITGLVLLWLFPQLALWPIGR